MMSGPFKTTRRVEFRDTDAAGIIHFSTYFAFMEQAEHELLRNVGLSVLMESGDQRISFPRVSASCDFRRPIRFEDVVDIEVSVKQLGEKSVTYAFRFNHNAAEIATGTMTSVCCRVDHDPPQSIPIPASIVEKLKPFVQ